MAAIFFYAIVLTIGAVFLLAVAHDEVTGVFNCVLDLFTRLLHAFDGPSESKSR
jgi:hypothetical protein